MSSPTHSSLTLREVQVARLVQNGLSNKEIGAQLGISERTVKFHVSRLLERTGAGNRTCLGRLMLENSDYAIVGLNDDDQVIASKLAKYRQQETTLEKRLRFVKRMIQVMQDYLSEKQPGQRSFSSPLPVSEKPLQAVVPIRVGRGHG